MSPSSKSSPSSCDEGLSVRIIDVFKGNTRGKSDFGGAFPQVAATQKNRGSREPLFFCVYMVKAGC